MPNCNPPVAAPGQGKSAADNREGLYRRGTGSFQAAGARWRIPLRSGCIVLAVAASERLCARQSRVRRLESTRNGRSQSVCRRGMDGRRRKALKPSPFQLVKKGPAVCSFPFIAVETVALASNRFFLMALIHRANRGIKHVSLHPPVCHHTHHIPPYSRNSNHRRPRVA